MGAAYPSPATAAQLAGEVSSMIYLFALSSCFQHLNSEWQKVVAFDYLVPALVDLSSSAGSGAVMQGRADHLLCQWTHCEQLYSTGLGGVLMQLAFSSRRPSESVAQLCKEVVRRVVEGTSLHVHQAMTTWEVRWHTVYTVETFTADHYSPTSYSLCHAVMDSPSITKQTASQFFSFLLTSLADGHPSVSGRSYVYT